MKITHLRARFAEWRSSSHALPVLTLTGAILVTLVLDLYDYRLLANGAPAENLLSLNLVESAIDLSFLLGVYLFMTRIHCGQVEQQKRLEALNKDLQRSRDEILRVSQGRAEILSVLAHDLRNPLGLIIGFADILRDSEPDDERRRHLQRITRASENALNLLNELLTRQSLDDGIMRLAPQFLDVRRVLNEVLTLSQAAAEKKQLRLELLAPRPMFAFADPVKLRQILLNVVSNAIKYSPHGQRIICDVVEDQESGVRLSVRDFGPGLTEDEQEHIFSRFTRVRKPTTGGETSTGLGLAITKMLVESHGGRIWAESSGLGHGTRFYIQLPKGIEVGQLVEPTKRQLNASASTSHS